MISENLFALLLYEVLSVRLIFFKIMILQTGKKNCGEMKNIGETYDIFEKSIIIIAIYDIQHYAPPSFFEDPQIKTFFKFQIKSAS